MGSTRRRKIGGVWMRCLSPGNWLSEHGTIAAMHMMQGTPYAMWELYLTKLAMGTLRRIPADPDTVEFLCADHWCSAFTFGELADDIAKLANWAHNLGRNLGGVCTTQAQHRAWGFGTPDPRLGFEYDGKARSPLLPKEK